MAPSTANPSNLHRAPVACLGCRAAKVRCFVSKRQSERCDRCVSTNNACLFARPKRARAAKPRHARRISSSGSVAVQVPLDGTTSAELERNQRCSREQKFANFATLAHAAQPRHNETNTTPDRQFNFEGREATSQPPPCPIITTEVRVSIIAILASLKSKRGSPFSFITAGDSPSFTMRGEPPTSHDGSQPEPQERDSDPKYATQRSSLKLCWLLKPLQERTSRSQPISSDYTQPAIRMPSYLSSLTLCHAMTDPIEGGILSRDASKALFSHFMLEMNTKWEYLLDPCLDTHDSVRQRSRLLFSTILFCSSKFATFSEGYLVSTVDAVLQGRLCSLARSLAVKTFAEGDRSIETMQAFYLLVCWKDADDDISYLHSGYAFRILHDLDMSQSNETDHQAVRCMRVWLALFRQDKQQSLFFMRRASLTHGSDDNPQIGELDTWLRLQHARPFDFVACCGADLRRIQSKLRVMVQKASATMLPCLLDLMESELERWRMTWKNHLHGEGRLSSHNAENIDDRLLGATPSHIATLVGLWRQSVRLNISAAILRQALVASVTSLCSTEQPLHAALPSIDMSDLAEILSPDVPGLNSCVEAALGTLRCLLAFPADDFRRAPDSTLLLGPNAALYLCLLLCLPCKGILGPAFQKAAVILIRQIALHTKRAVQSPQDTLNLHAAYLESLVDLLGPAAQLSESDTVHNETRSCANGADMHVNPDKLHLDETALQAPQVLASGINDSQNSLNGPNVINDVDNSDQIFAFVDNSDRSMHMQSLVNLMDMDFFWDTISLTGTSNPD